jgi:hypothetical protein
MKSLLAKLGVNFIGLIIFTCAEVCGADWKYYGECEFSIHHYDSESISRPSNTLS